MPTDARRNRSHGGRAVLIALAGVPVACLLTLWGDLVVGGAPWGSGFPPLGPTLMLTVLAVVSAITGRRRPGARFAPGELLFAYAVWVVVAGLPGRGMAMFLLPNLTGFLYYERASREALFGHRVPEALAPRDSGAVRALYEGAPGAGVAWGVWVEPLLAWSALYLSLWLVGLGFSLLLGPVWAREERVTFPAAQLPLAIAGADGAIWRRGIFWVGVGVPVLLHGMNLLHAWNPLLPALPLADVNLDAALAERPWSALRPFRLSLFPALVGILYLAPVELLFSLWFFWGVGRAVRMVGELGGLTPPGAPFGVAVFPYTEAQGVGAVAALALWLLWRGRLSLQESLRGAVGGRGEERKRGRRGWLMLVTGASGLLLWSRAVGWNPGSATAFYGLLLASMLVYSRLIAEGGFLWPPAPTSPETGLLALTGAAHREPSDLTLLALQSQLARDPRGWLAPHFFHGERLVATERSAADPRLPPDDRDPRPAMSDRRLTPGAALLPFLWLVALLLGLAVTLPLTLAFVTERGGLTLGGAGRWAFTHFANEPFVRLSAWLGEPAGPNLGAIVATAIGAVLAFGLALARARLLWWPFHPLGYVVSVTPEQLFYAQMILSFFLAWGFKYATLRWGGLPLYRTLRLAAMGLVLGDLAMGAFGSLVAALTDAPAPSVWPG